MNKKNLVLVICLVIAAGLIIQMAIAEKGGKPGKPEKPDKVKPQCKDKIDNDGDGLIDYHKKPSKGDPGCDSKKDNNEGECYQEGESRPVVPGVPGCCEGLQLISCSAPGETGTCPPYQCVGAAICANCGDGNCGLGENKCNCPEDCGSPA